MIKMKSSGGVEETFNFVLSLLTLLTAPRAKFPRVVTPDDELTRSTSIVQRSPDKKKNIKRKHCSASSQTLVRATAWQFLCIFNNDNNIRPGPFDFNTPMKNLPG